MRIRFQPLIAALAGLAATGLSIAGPEVVLVASKRSPVGQMAVAEARNLFLGLPVGVGGQALKPVRNTADGVVTEAFMQRVMFMSAEDYERQIRTRVTRSGGSRPAAYGDLTEVTTVLQRDPLAVTYMERSQAKHSPGLKIIGEP
ncbi:MAG: hypothetical protein H6R10_2815 [Rhodocyclaceae bacterium]|nr:hypothetical protein [Rhodocyclaceae bacterium]